MKNKLMLLIVAVVFGILMAFGTDKPNLGSVNQVQGYYVYWQSKPVNEYQYLGSIQVYLVWSAKPSSMLRTMIRKAKRKFPQGDAIIFTADNMDKADIVKLK